MASHFPRDVATSFILVVFNVTNHSKNFQKTNGKIQRQNVVHFSVQQFHRSHCVLLLYTRHNFEFPVIAYSFLLTMSDDADELHRRLVFAQERSPTLDITLPNQAPISLQVPFDFWNDLCKHFYAESNQVNFT